MVAANMEGTQKFLLLVIGHSKNPRCFRNVKSLPVKYVANKRAWMTVEIFHEWLRNHDKRFHSQGRKVAFVVDNCPAHGNISGLEAIKLFFLPPGTTCKTQPMDQGVIQNIKCHYRQRLLHLLLTSIESGNELGISLLDALYGILSAWNSVTLATILNCFRHCGFVRDEDMPEVEIRQGNNDESVRYYTYNISIQI
jgi:hypothetical protein